MQIQSYALSTTGYVPHAESPLPEQAASPSDGYVQTVANDPGLMPAPESGQAEENGFWADVGFGAGMGALITAVATPVVLPFIGFALVPFTAPLGALVGGAAAALAR